MNPETDIICLEIVRGVPKAPGDIESAEQDLVVLDLLDGDGFAVQPNGWTPAFPGLKGNGVWAQTQTEDGRQLIAAAKDNVTETIQLAIGNTDLRQRYQLLTKLERLAEDARAFWVGYYQIDPVYLKFKANGAPCHQYALIYNLNVAQNNDPFDTAVGYELTLTIERESAWRMVVPPGGNPIEYHFFTLGKTRGVDYDYTDMQLTGQTDQWIYATHRNMTEFNGPDKTTFLTTNWVDIDASKIPGDAPALLCVSYDLGFMSDRVNQVYMARRTEPRRRYHRELDEYAYQRNTLNCGDANTATKVIDSCGVRSNGSSSNYYIHQATVLAATTTFTKIIEWRLGAGTGGEAIPFTQNQMHGQWAVYARCTATSGNDGDLEIQLQIDPLDGNIEVYDAADVPAVNGGGTTCADYDIVYLGRLSIPFNSRPYASRLGYGLNQYDDSWYIQIYIRNNAGANRVFEMVDLVFIPIDEGFCIANPDSGSRRSVSSGGATSSPIIVDNTGYFNHGHTETYCAFDGNDTSVPTVLQLLGNSIMLKPRVDNRLYFMFRWYSSVTGDQYTPISNIGGLGQQYGYGVVSLNIVPRCYGIADL